MKFSRVEVVDGAVHLGTVTDGHITVSTPLTLTLLRSSNTVVHRSAYSHRDDEGRWTAEIDLGNEVRVQASDRWTIVDGLVELDRRVHVSGSDTGGFTTSLSLPLPWEHRETEPFAPGIIYGDSAVVNPFAIGGAGWLAAGIRGFAIREDRLPSPVVALRQAGTGNYICLLHADPVGSTTPEDALGSGGETLVDGAFRFGSLEWSAADNTSQIGFTYPASEGPVTYRGDVFPDGQMHQWRRRYHPLQHGLTSNYRLQMWAGSGSRNELVKDLWRTSWATLAPQVATHDLDEIRDALTQQALTSVVRKGGRTGFPLMLDSRTGKPLPGEESRASMATIGFTGKNTELAYWLLRESERSQSTTAQELRATAVDVLDTFVTLPIAPPLGEGFDLETGAILGSAPWGQRVDVAFLRSLSEGGKGVVRSWRAETARGVDRPSWLSWAVALGDWLLGQQSATGGLPRSWVLGSGDVADESEHSSVAVLAFLIELYRATGNAEYLDAAVRAGEFSWSHGHSSMSFHSGTLDNPGVIDNEAGCLALEGYLLLFEETQDDQWLARAEVAATFSETWMYLWNVPMPADADGILEWDPNVSTVGAQLIATGHSLVGQYMTCDAGRFAMLHTYTGDGHYLDVARVLLHNTKGMMATRSHPRGLVGPGWQQEHWSFAPTRGRGLHRSWLPWLTSGHLEGIITFQDHSPELFAQIPDSPRA